MNPDQVEVLALAIALIFAGPAGTYNAETLEKLWRASGLPHHYGRECAQAVLVDAIARRGFFAETGTTRPER